MTKTQKKFMALAAVAVLGTAGIAYATNRSISEFQDNAAVAITAGDILTDQGVATDSVAPAVLDTAADLTVTIPTGQTTTFAPAGGTLHHRITNNGTGALSFKFPGEGTLVFKGANGENPDTTYYNNFTGPVTMKQGTLRLTDYNAIGYAPIVIDVNKPGTAKVEARDRDIDLGLKSPHAADNGMLVNQNVQFTNFSDSLVAVNNIPVTFDVEKNLNFVLHRGIEETAAADRAQIVKTGTGRMKIYYSAVRNFGGFLLNEGSFEMDGTVGKRLDGEIGAVYNANLVTRDELKPGYAGLGAADTGINVILAADLDSGLNDANKFGFESKAGTTLTTNSDQYFTSFDGAGTVVGVRKNTGTTNEWTPRLTVWLNKPLNTTKFVDSTYTGKITDYVDLVLDGARSSIPSGAADEAAARRIHTLRL